MRQGATSPCRLTVYLAMNAPLGLVLRRGPSSWTRLSLWHTDTDTFEHGQWLRGRVYERRMDLSPDGSLLVYFVRKTVRDTPEDSWVAVSRPPYFTALALWWVGGTYFTGGYFPDRQSLWLGFNTSPPDQGELPSWLTMTGPLPPYLERSNEWPDRTVFFNRLLRDGWTRARDEPPDTWEHPHPDGHQALVMVLHEGDFNDYGGRYSYEYAVRVEAAIEPYPIGFATWADWDQQGRLVIAREGRLLSWGEPDRMSLLADFNDQVPESIEAPDWARAWPSL